MRFGDAPGVDVPQAHPTSGEKEGGRRRPLFKEPVV